MSKGLFHRAIAMSTLGTNQNQLPYQQNHLVFKQAQLLGCPTDTLDNIFECFYTKSAEDFGNSLSGFAEFFNDPILIWSPVVEVNHTNDNDEAFLVEQPFDIIRKRKANFVPFITGINKDELIGVVIEAEEQAQKGNALMYDKINRNWDIYTSISLGYTREEGRAARISNEWRMDYLKNRPLSLGNYQGLAQVYADGLINFPVHRFERLMAEYSSESVFKYFYVYQGCESFSKWSNGTNYGVVHKDELILLFKVGGFLPPCYKDWKNLERLGGIIEYFAKNGKPFSDNDPFYSSIEWQPTTLNEPKYLKIDEELTMENGIIYKRRMNDWEDQFPLNSIAV
uniref:Carboxylesterase 8 n=1 Tax=Meteorus pulchricornis TaxID=51522 RepID=A0A4D6J5V4_9HYME|nr:carboxylesterase 8 [Meteorus pulchricornis]